MFYDIDDSSKLKSKEEHILKWIKLMPMSRKRDINTVYYYNNQDLVFKNLHKVLPELKYLVDKNLKNEIDNYIQEYDLIIVNKIDDNFNKNNLFDLIKKLSSKGKIWFFLEPYHKINEIIEDLNKEFDLNLKKKKNKINFIKKFLDNLNIKYFNTRINYSYLLDDKSINNILGNNYYTFDKKCKIVNFIKKSYFKFTKLPLSIFTIG